MSAGKNNTKVSATAAQRIHLLEALAKETRATPDQYDKNWRLALGTLGGGNHFIELAEDGEGAVWVTLHSGSRGVAIKLAATTSKWPNSSAPRKACVFQTGISRT